MIVIEKLKVLNNVGQLKKTQPFIIPFVPCQLIWTNKYMSNKYICKEALGTLFGLGLSCIFTGEFPGNSCGNGVFPWFVGEPVPQSVPLTQIINQVPQGNKINFLHDSNLAKYDVIFFRSKSLFNSLKERPQWDAFNGIFFMWIGRLKGIQRSILEN